MTIARTEAPLFDPPRYDLSAEELDQLSDTFLRSHETNSTERFQCFEVCGDDPAANIGRTVEVRVFGDVFKDEAATLQKVYRPYDTAASRFFISFDIATGQPVGALRVIENSPAGILTVNELASGGLKTKDDRPFVIPEAEFLLRHNLVSLDGVWDVCSVAVMKEYRHAQAGIGLQLFRGLYRTSVENDVVGLVAMLDHKINALLTKRLRMPFVPEPGSENGIQYLGSDSTVAAYAVRESIIPAMDAYRNSLLGRFTMRVLDRKGRLTEAFDKLTKDTHPLNATIHRMNTP